MSNSYQKQNWNTYDYEQSIQRNIERNAVVTEENMNHIEAGVQRANRPIIPIVRTGAKKFAVDIQETENATIFDFSFPDTQTDTSLQLKGIPADSKTTGDALDALTYAVQVLTQRMDNIIKLPESDGEATIDADELADIRITINGDTYDTAGGAVRAQFNEMKTAINLINDKLNEANGVASICDDTSYEPLES